jgi:electron transfer flavoprotein alpha subunit
MRRIEHALPENIAPAVAALMSGYDAPVCAGHVERQEYRAARGALLDVMQISDILSVESADTFTRPIYAGNAIATVQSSDAKKVITVRGTAFEKAAAAKAAAPRRSGRPAATPACRTSSVPRSPSRNGQS